MHKNITKESCSANFSVCSGSTTIHIFPFNSGVSVGVYIDGVSPPDGNPSTSNLGMYNISQTASVLAIQATNNKNQFLVSSDDGWILTNSTSWRCVAQVTSSTWNQMDFDDSRWPNAVELGRNDGSYADTVVPGIHPDAAWISASNLTISANIYCRFYFGIYMN